MDDLQIIRPKQAAKLLGVHLSTLYRWEANGKLPFPKVKIGPGSVGFFRQDIAEHLKSSINKEDS